MMRWYLQLPFTDFDTTLILLFCVLKAHNVSYRTRREICFWPAVCSGWIISSPWWLKESFDMNDGAFRTSVCAAKRHFFTSLDAWGRPIPFKMHLSVCFFYAVGRGPPSGRVTWKPSTWRRERAKRVYSETVCYVYTRTAVWSNAPDEHTAGSLLVVWNARW